MNLDEIKPGMIGISGGNGFIQRGIRFFTGSAFTHSFCVGMVEGELGVVETTELQVHCASVKKKLDEPDWVWIWEPIADAQKKKKAFEEVFLKYVDCWYGYLSYLWFMYRWVMRKFGKEPKTIWKWASGGVTCTELTCHYLVLLNIFFKDAFCGLDLNTQSPQELLKIMQSRPDLFRPVGWLKPPPDGIL